MSEPNTRYPGRPDYTGPSSGWCFAIHHGVLIEWTHDIHERLHCIDTQKDEWERAERRRQLAMMREDELPAELVQARTEDVQAGAAYDQARTAYYQAGAAFVRARTAYVQAGAAYDQARVNCEPQLVALLSRYVPDHTWDGKRFVLPKPPARVTE